MKISKRTIDILKNFSVINNTIFFDESKIAKTRSIAGNIYAIADIEEEFPNFGIYQLNELLGVISLFDLENTDFIFEDKYLIVKSGRSSARYGFTDLDLLPCYGKIKKSDNYKSFDKFDAGFSLSEEDINKIKKSSSIMKLPHLEVSIADGKGKLKIKDNENPLSNNFKMTFEGNGNCGVEMNVQNLLLMSYDYEVGVSKSTLIRFLNKDKNLMYFISVKS